MLTLRELTQSDLADYLRLLTRLRARPATAAFADRHGDLPATPEWAAYHLEHFPEDGSTAFAIIEDGRTAGLLELTPAAPGRYSLVIWLDAEHADAETGQGAAELAVGFLRDVASVRGVAAGEVVPISDVYCAVPHGDAVQAAALAAAGFRAAAEAGMHTMYQLCFTRPGDEPVVPRRRRSSRVLLVDEADRLLLFNSRVQDMLTGEPRDVWVTPGGGVDPGESPEQAAVREIREETGRTDVELVREVWRGRSRISAWGGVTYEIRNHYFLSRVRSFAVDTSGFEEQEVAGHLGEHWWSLEELAATGHPLRPRGLPGLLADLLAGRAPAFPLLTDG